MLRAYLGRIQFSVVYGYKLTSSYWIRRYCITLLLEIGDLIYSFSSAVPEYTLILLRIFCYSAIVHVYTSA